MPLAAADRSRIAEIQRSLGVYVDGGPSGIATIIQPLRDLFRFDVSYAYGVEEDGDTYRLSLSETSGGCGPRRTRQVMAELVSGQGGRFAAFDPRRPEPWNRNTTLVYEDLARRRMQAGPVSEIALPRLGLRAQDQMRVLVCEGPSLLAWVGGFRRDQPYTQRDRRALGALVPSLRRRFVLERTLASRGLTQAALEVALEAIGAPTFLLTASGAPVLANAAGRAALDFDPVSLRAKLNEAVRSPQRDEFRVVPVDSPGCPRRFLAIGRPAPRVQAQVQAAVSRWGLSRRQAQVLAWVLEGAANARIGAELRIADRTVETHVTAILRRAQVCSRAELIVAAMRA